MLRLKAKKRANLQVINVF